MSQNKNKTLQKKKKKQQSIWNLMRTYYQGPLTFFLFVIPSPIFKVKNRQISVPIQTLQAPLHLFLN